MMAKANESLGIGNESHTPEYPRESPWFGLPIHHLVLEMPGFIVFLDKELDVDWKTTDEYDRDETVNCDERGDVLNRVAFLQAVPVGHLKAEQRIGFRRMLGEAVARALEGNLNDATGMLEKAEEFVTLRNSEHARLWYLSAGAISAGLVSGIALTCWVGKARVTAVLGPALFDLILAAGAGAVGAILSIYRRVAKLPLDPSAGRAMHYFEGGGHVALGCIGAVVVSLATKSGIVVPQLVTSPNGRALQLLLCVVAGASERLVPSLVHRFELAFSQTRRK